MQANYFILFVMRIQTRLPHWWDLVTRLISLQLKEECWDNYREVLKYMFLWKGSKNYYLKKNWFQLQSCIITAVCLIFEIFYNIILLLPLPQFSTGPTFMSFPYLTIMSGLCYIDEVSCVFVCTGICSFFNLPASQTQQWHLSRRTSKSPFFLQLTKFLV